MAALTPQTWLQWALVLILPALIGFGGGSFGQARHAQDDVDRMAKVESQIATMMERCAATQGRLVTVEQGLAGKEAAIQELRSILWQLRADIQVVISRLDRDRRSDAIAAPQGSGLAGS